MEQIDKKIKKTDLLEFQRVLNSHFLEIFESKKSGLNVSAGEQDEADLGLEAEASGIQFFLPLKILKTISIDNSFENSIQTKSWIMGFNQLRGEIYTITDFEKIVTMILENKTDNVKNRLGLESRIVYLKNDSKLAFILNKLKLDYTAELTSIFKYESTEHKSSWKLSEDVEFESFVKKERMSDIEWKLMSEINNLVSSGTGIENNSEDLTNANILLFVKEVYLDSNGARPVFVLHAENLTNYLSNVSPF